MITLQAEKRTILGKSVKALRKKGLLPAVVYGGKTASSSIEVSLKSFKKVLAEAGESTLVTLSLEGKSLNVLIHDVLLDPLTDIPLHADFLAVEMDKEIRTNVELEFVGEAPGAKADSGVLVKVMHEVEISALPKDLPHSIPVNLERLEHVNDRIILRDVALPHGVKVITDLDEVVALLEAPRSEEELKALEATEAPAVVEVETEQEVKRKAEEVKASTEEE